MSLTLCPSVSCGAVSTWAAGTRSCLEKWELNTPQKSGPVVQSSLLFPSLFYAQSVCSSIVSFALYLQNTASHRFSLLSCGALHTLAAIEMANDDSQVLYAIGSNEKGQLGIGDIAVET